MEKTEYRIKGYQNQATAIFNLTVDLSEVSTLMNDLRAIEARKPRVLEMRTQDLLVDGEEFAVYRLEVDMDLDADIKVVMALIDRLMVACNGDDPRLYNVEVLYLTYKEVQTYELDKDEPVALDEELKKVRM